MKKFGLLLVSVLSWVFLAACAGTLKYQVPGTKALGADLHVLADVNESANLTKLELSAVNLAPPDRISAGATAYVVWSRRNAESPWTRLGALEYDADTRTAKLSATTPETAFDLLVTAESMATAASPSPEAVFSQRVAKQ
ncbi:hypothetical protein L6R52_20655 [Myxococcota bacterium]|nr:hypothetical protein [Myxococcota bacterium]